MPDEPWPLDGTVEFNSCDELLSALLRKGSPDLIYRGQNDFNLPLECTLSRYLRREAEAGGPISIELMDSMVVDEAWSDHVRRTETRLLRNFMTCARDLGVARLPDRDDRVGWWEVMQHHGAPTRLLDWTRSPFIGLWFAYWRHCSGDASLWVFDARNSWINHVNTVTEPDSARWQDFLDDRHWQNALAEAAVAKR